MDATFPRRLPNAGPIALLRSALFNTWFWLWTVLMAIVILPFLALPGRRMWPLVLFWMAGLAFGLRVLGGLGHRTLGLEHLPKEPVILAVKHQSAWETLVLPLIRRDVAIVLKQELSNLPFFGWYTRKTGMIAVQRTAGASALKRLIAQSRRTLAEGRSILIFPEGTRTMPGERRGYHPGIAALYAQLGVPVVPVAHDAGLFWPRRSFVKRPGVITVAFLRPIPPGLDRRAFMTVLRDSIEGATDRLLAGQSVEERIA